MTAREWAPGLALACLIATLPRALLAQEDTAPAASAFVPPAFAPPAFAPPASPAVPVDTVLPREGVDGDQPDLRDHLLDAFGTPPAASVAGRLPRSGLQITKKLGVSEEFTDNSGRAGGTGSAGGGGPDFITLIQPEIAIADSTQRFEINLDYAPTGEIYARQSDFSQFEQQANGDLLGTVVPGWFYVDARGSVSQQSVYGGFGRSTNVLLAPDNRETVSSVAVTPYASRTFGGAGLGQMGVAYIYSATDAPGSAQAGNPLFGQGNYGSSNLATERAFANFTTGENLARLQDKVAIDANRYDGSGVLRNARRITLTDDASYAITRQVALLGQVGYEDLAYPAADFRYSGPIGSAGVQLSVNRQSRATIEYRYVDGIGAALVQLSWQATRRIRLFGGYSSGISTQQQDQQNTLLSGTNDVTGALASATLAVPLLGNSNSFGSQQDLHRISRIDANFAWLGNRSTFVLSVQDERTTPVGRPLFGVANRPTSALFVNASWERELSSTTSVSASVQYGSSQTALDIGGGNTADSDTISASLGVHHSFSDTLSGYVRLNANYVVSGYDNLGGQNGNEADVVVGVVKTF